MPTHATHVYTVTEAAAIIAVSASQVRNWCAQFADYLSDQANPAPGQARALTAADVATLQRVAELRAAGVGYSEIPGQLALLDVGELVPYVEPAPAPIDQTRSPQTAIELYAAIESRFQQMQGHIDRLQTAQVEEERRRLSAVTMFGFGAIVGLLLVIALVALFMLGVWAGG
jgi:DNA-binding transcriptional MerR regulator